MYIVRMFLQTFRPKKKWDKGTMKYDLHKKAKVKKPHPLLHVHVNITTAHIQNMTLH